MDYSSNNNNNNNNYRGSTTTNNHYYYPAMIPEITERSSSSDDDNEVYTNNRNVSIPDYCYDDTVRRRGSPNRVQTHRTLINTSSVVVSSSDYNDEQGGGIVDQRKPPSPPPVTNVTKENPPGRCDNDDDDDGGCSPTAANQTRTNYHNDPAGATKLTGLFGTSISSIELVLILLILSIIIGAIIGGIMYFLYWNDNTILTNDEDMQYLTPPTVSPTPEIPFYDDDSNALYEAIRLAVEKYQPAALDGDTTLPEDPSYIDSYTYTIKKLYYNRWYQTLNWILMIDRRKHYEIETIQRFVVSFLFFEFGGYYWENQTNWLSSSHICDWYGITCQDIEQTISLSNNTTTTTTNETVATASWTRTERVVTELNLRNNSLKGILSYIPFELLSDTIEVLDFKDNQLRGTIPSIAFRSLPKLRSLYLNYNNLSGTIPISLIDNGSLETLYVQGNNLTGIWPFCQKNNNNNNNEDDGTTTTVPNNGTSTLTNYGLDCSQTPCPMGCCKSFKNCF